MSLYTFDLTGIYQYRIYSHSGKYIVYRYPENTGGLHRHTLNACFNQPISKLYYFISIGTEYSYLCFLIDITGWLVSPLFEVPSLWGLVVEVLLVFHLSQYRIFYLKQNTLIEFFLLLLFVFFPVIF